ncbi:hypothetical protein GGI15_004230 [Coemansia interrupta]|uniref:Uncharacterized protein n=1 Tax=Coemansia interrupta TaxID=1126814 RepID=A0A9W8H5E8_9FUNG|nr:hypothetical protein GGI15_004230 [Coemansia interrupta]
MVLPPSAAGIDSFCDLQEYSDYTQYVFLICTVVVWEYLPGIVGIISVSIIIVHIIRAKRETKKAMRTSSQFYGTTRAVHLQSHPDMLNQSLRNIIWFPITPIVSLWLNAALISVHYYTGRSFKWLEFVNVVLLGLQSVLLAIALVVNPSVRYVMIDHLRKKRRIRREKQMAQSDRSTFYEHPEYGLPRIDSISSISSSFSTLNSLSDTTASDL